MNSLSTSLEEPAYISHLTSPATPNLPKPKVTTAVAQTSRNGTKQYRQPRSPLPPHRLAKLANALGVSTPLPASPLPSPSLTRPLGPAGISNPRSPTPSSISSRPASRYLLHVFPPSHFPHEAEGDPDSSLSRGSLVPLQSNLQTQLSAIAREYSLPSTHGMLLYLIADSGSDDAPMNRSGPRLSGHVWNWLWQRVSEEQLSTGVGLGLSSRSASPSSLDGPSPLRKLSSSASLKTQAFDSPSYPLPLTPAPSTPSTTTSKRRSRSHPKIPSTQANSGDRHTHSANASPERQSTGLSSSDFDLDTGLLPGLGSPSIIPVLAKVEFDFERRDGNGWYDSWSRSRRDIYERQRKSRMRDSENGARASMFGRSKTKSIGLGIITPVPVIPVKVEVPEDEEAEKVEVEAEAKEVDEGEEQEAEAEEAEEAEAETESEADGYAPLSESPVSMDGDDEGEIVDSEDHIQILYSTPGRYDPLADVFGTDEESFLDLRSARPKDISAFSSSPNKGMEHSFLALDGESLAALPDLKSDLPDDDLVADDLDRPTAAATDRKQYIDEKEVEELWNQLDKPKFNFSEMGIEISSPTNTDDSQPYSATIRKPIPPRLDLSRNTLVSSSKVIAASSSSSTSSEEGHTASTPGLAYADKRDNVQDGGDADVTITTLDDVRPNGQGSPKDYSAVRRSFQEEKRDGVLYEDLELDLDGIDVSLEYDQNDPNDRRRSQYRMHLELNLLEQSIAQLSPRALKVPDLSLSAATLNNHLPLHSAPPGVVSFAPGQISPLVPREGGLTRSSSARAADSNTLSAQAPGLAIRAGLQHIPVARPSVEIEEEVAATPPAFRSPVLVGTPSPRDDSFSGHEHPAQQSSVLNSFFSSQSRSSRRPDSRGMNSSPPRLSLGRDSAESSRSSIARRRKQSTSTASSSSVLSVRHDNTVPSPQPGSLVIPSSSSHHDQDEKSPVIPLSPDPFGRFASGRSSSTFDQYDGGDSTFSIPPRTSSIWTRQDEEQDTDSKRVPTPSSRFSADSVSAEEPGTKGSNRNTIISVKGLKKFWRKSNKNSISSTVPPPSEGPLPPQTPVVSQQPQHQQFYDLPPPTPLIPHTPIPSPSLSSNPQPPRSPMVPYAAMSQRPGSRHNRSDSGLDPFYFDQESKYPVHRSVSPHNQPSSRPVSRAPTPSPIVLGSPSIPPAMPNTAPLPPVPSTAPPLPNNDKTPARKSILKWKSSMPSLSNNGKEGRDVPTTPRKRRPSVLDVVNSFGSGRHSSSISSVTDQPVPALPAEYRRNQSTRSSISQGVANERGYDDDASSHHRRAAPQSTSTDSLRSSPPIRTPSNASLSHRGLGIASGSPRVSEETRPSFDTVSQFEIVSPKFQQHSMEPSLSYGSLDDRLHP